MAGLFKSAWRETKQAGAKIQATVADKTKRGGGGGGEGQQTDTFVHDLIGQEVIVSDRRFRIDRQIGEGGLSYVFQATESATGASYALKRSLLPPGRKCPLEVELKVLKSLPPHKNVIRLEASHVRNGVGSDDNIEIITVIEMCRQGSLHDQLLKRPRPLTEAEIYAQLQQVCQALYHLHTQNPPIAHRDIKCENVLVADDGTLKLIDFGSCTTKAWRCDDAAERSAAEDDIGANTTLAFRAPEMIDLFRKQLINHKVDVWAVGCMAFRMAYGYIPFEEALGILNMRYTLPEHTPHSPNMLAFIKWLWTDDPAARPDISEVLGALYRARGLAPPSLARIAAQPLARLEGRPVKAEVVDNKTAIAALQWESNANERPLPQHSAPVPTFDAFADDDQPLPLPGNIRGGGAAYTAPTPQYAQPAPVTAVATNSTQRTQSPAGSSLPPAPPDLTQQLQVRATEAYQAAQDLWLFSAAPAPNGTPAHATSLIKQHWVNPRRRLLDAFFALLWGHTVSEPTHMLQALSLMHNLVLQGSPVLLHEIVQHAPQLDQIRKSVISGGYLADCARTYAAYLVRRLRLHGSHPELEGNFAVDTFLAYANRSQPTTADLISIGFLNELFSCLSDALLVAATVFAAAARNPNPNPNALDATVASIVVPLYTDAYAIFSYVTYAFQQLLNESTLGGELGDLVPLYISKHIALADFARAAGSLFDMRGAPQLPPTPPELRRGMTCPTVMPRSLNPFFRGAAIPTHTQTQTQTQAAPAASVSAAPPVSVSVAQTQTQTQAQTVSHVRTQSPSSGPVPAVAMPASASSLAVPTAAGGHPTSSGRWSPGLSPRSQHQREQQQLLMQQQLMQQQGAAAPPGQQVQGAPAATPIAAPTAVKPQPIAKPASPAPAPAANPNANPNAHHDALQALLAQPANRVCADCRAPSSTWASVTLGIFLCHRCAGAHRVGLSVQISRIRSVQLDIWEPAQVDTMSKIGNARSNQIYEARIGTSDIPPTSASTTEWEEFVRAKYERKRWAVAAAAASGAGAATDARTSSGGVASAQAASSATSVASGAAFYKPAPAPAGVTSNAAAQPPPRIPSPLSATQTPPTQTQPQTPAPTQAVAAPPPQAPVQQPPQTQSPPPTQSQAPPPVPARPARDPVNGSRLRGKWDFAATQPGDLSFKKGDIILFISKVDDGWWEGSLNGEIGIFPCTYVEMAP